MRKGRLLAAVAALGLIAAPAGGLAATHGKASVKRAKVTRAVKRRVAVRRVRAVAPVAQSFVPVAATAFEAPAPVDYEAYRWLDDADAMVRTVSIGTPDFAFEDAGARRFAWRLAEGGVVIAEPIGYGETRLYFFAADMTAPFLVRDRLHSFGFDRGQLAAVYDREGRLLPPGEIHDGQADGAAGLYALGRRLWFAAQAPQRVQRRPVISLNFFAGTDSWREDDGWRAYRRRAHRDGGWHDGRDRGHERDRDRDRWAHRGERPGGSAPDGRPGGGRPDGGGWSHQAPEEVAGRPGGPRRQRDPDQPGAPGPVLLDAPAEVAVRPDRARRPHDAGQPGAAPEQVAVDAPAALVAGPPTPEHGPGRRWDGERRVIPAMVQPDAAPPAAAPAVDIRPEERADGGPTRRSEREEGRAFPIRAERIAAAAEARPELRAEAPRAPEVRAEAPPPAPEPRAEAPRAERPEPSTPRERFAQEKQRQVDPNRDEPPAD